MYQAFYTPSSPYFLLLNDVLAITTIVSITALVLESVAALQPYALLFTTVEYVAVGIFTTEYAARWYAHGSAWRKYSFSFFGIVDLLAILPSYLGFANLTFLKSARVFRILQLLRMVRLVKLTRRTAAATHDRRSADRLTLQIYFFALTAALLCFGTLLYVIEPHNPEFANIPLAMLWVAKPLLGGIAQTFPTTIWGDILVSLVRFSGLVLFGLLVSIIGTNVRTLLLGDPSSLGASRPDLLSNARRN